jgi:hypothetical protein
MKYIARMVTIRPYQLPDFITCGSMGPRYFLQHLFSENNKIARKSRTTKAREKNSTDLDSLEF